MYQRIGLGIYAVKSESDHSTDSGRVWKIIRHEDGHLTMEFIDDFVGPEPFEVIELPRQALWLIRMGMSAGAVSPEHGVGFAFNRIGSDLFQVVMANEKWPADSIWWFRSIDVDNIIDNFMRKESEEL